MGAGNLCLINWVILTKETQAASSRILTKRSSNCSTTNSHKDFPETDKNTSHTWKPETRVVHSVFTEKKGGTLQQCIFARFRRRKAPAQDITSSGGGLEK